MKINQYSFEINCFDLKSKLENLEDILLLDVREPHEYNLVHLDCIWIPLNKLLNQYQQLDKNRHIIVYCHHGVRSAMAVQFLRHQGFEKVQNLTGGIHQWSIDIDSAIKKY